MKDEEIEYAAQDLNQTLSVDEAKSINSDDALLLSMGKKPELRRVYNFWTLCAYQIMISCSWSCLVVLYSTIFDIGGPFCLLWGTLFVAVGQTLLMMSLAEYCSIWPTAGGQQYYTQAVATGPTRPFLSYFVGWAVIVGEISTGSSCALNSADIIASFVEVTHPDFAWHPWHTWLIYSAFLIGPIAINLKQMWLPTMNLVGAFWTIAGGVAWAIVFGVMAKPKHDAEFIFTEFINNSGYTSKAWVFIMSFYSPMYGLYGTDGMMHLVEEMKDASKQAPRVMVWSMIFCSITSWLAALLMMWTAGNWESYMTASQPYMNWWMDVTHSVYGGGIFCALIMMGLNFFIIVGTNLAGSRLAWSMARDKGLPFSEYFAHVSTRFHIPLRTMVAILVIDLIIGLIVLGSDLAFESIISGGGVTLQIGYVTPIIVVLIRGRKILPARPYFDLGRWGYFVNIISVCWSLIIIAMYLSPLIDPDRLMRSFILLGRCAGPRGWAQFACRIPRRQQSFSRWTRKYSLKDPRQRRYSPLLAAAAALSSAAFVEISEDHDENKTVEMQMLEASRREISKKVPEDAHGLRRFYKSIIYFLDQYIYEPFATGVRFLYLVVIFVPVIATVPIVFVGTRRKDRDNERSGTIWWYSFLVTAMERAGPAFIKLGQWAASRSDIFPAEMCKVMSTLHSNAPAHSLRHTKRTICEAFGGRNFDEIFLEFDEKPLGVGAIAQVYKARLKPDLAKPDDSDLEHHDKDRLRHRIRRNVNALVKSSPQRIPSAYVAIKVLHPKVERNVRRDLKIMAIFASIINAIPTLEWLDLPNEVTNFGEMMRLQLDLRIEAANLTILRKNFQKRTTAWFPHPYTDFTSRTVLVEEFAQGLPLAAFLESGGGAFQQEIANEGLDAFLHMLLIDNFVHADLHPGNIMVNFYKPTQPDIKLPYMSRQDPTQPWTATEIDESEAVLSRLRPHVGKKEEWLAALNQIDKEGYRPQLIFIDTGLVTELNSKNRTNFLDLFRAIAEFDGYRAGHLMIQRCRQPDAVIDGEVFALKMQHLVISIKGQTFALGHIKIGDVLSQVLGMVRSHHVRMEGDFVNVVISILLLEGIGRTLDPDLDLFKSALPILRQLGSSDPGAVLKSFKEGDFSLLKIWVGLEARRFFQASADSVEMCVKYDLLSPNF
ncbi:hypothetical protein LTR41_000884 [Exophiala xenobiotica]|nr:hypothetical protein LTR41_000884 [Exophiala xenobiotica]